MTKAKRTMTAILSAIMMMTTAAAITASADDTKVSFNTLESDFGTIELTQARLEPDKVVRVHLASDYQLKNKSDESKTIPYDIVSTDDVGTSGSLKWNTPTQHPHRNPNRKELTA